MGNIQLIKKLIPNGKLALGVSGGIDSVACLHFLSKNKENRNNIAVFHTNNKLVPGDDLSEKKVRELCKKLGISCHVFTSINKYVSGSKEAWARGERHLGFEKLSLETDISNILLCHHLDDAVNSWIFNILRGHENYFPIPLQTSFKSYVVYRPFLLNKKEILEKYINKNDLAGYVSHDILNDDINLSRNFIGKKIVPLILSRKQFGVYKVVLSKILNKVSSE